MYEIKLSETTITNDKCWKFLFFFIISWFRYTWFFFFFGTKIHVVFIKEITITNEKRSIIIPSPKIEKKKEP